ncbi:response regulator [Variovorax sp. PCZ-1]|uniref:response regulator n=1 Tax=Variovorax sp. PCZ-1 TaxID=2835533 RepID=UPI001BCB7222|nr:response regulator [Variovorax sp. PCZ-1]MBS7807376.1 response regulator [Variovorax sp. PCZ-1]
MKRGQTPEFELPDDLVIGTGDDDDGRMGAGSTLPQDLFPLGEPRQPHRSPDARREYADTQPAGLPAQTYVRSAAPEVKVSAAQAIIAPMPATGRSPRDGPQPKRVLVVDDDATVRLYLRARLMLRGHLQLLEAANGEQALELVMSQRFDAVLLDIDMGAQNGYEVCRAIRTHTRQMGSKQPRIYIITSRSGVIDKMRAKMAGADAFLSKPPHPGELSELLAQL